MKKFSLDKSDSNTGKFMKLESLIVIGLKAYPEPNHFKIENFDKLTTFIGPNGSGKTTVLRTIESILKFLTNREFNSKHNILDEWNIWNEAVLTVSLENGATLPDWEDQECSSLTITLLRKDNEIYISKINNSKKQIKLKDINNIYLNNPKVSELQDQLDINQVSLGIKRADLQAHEKLLTQKPGHSPTQKIVTDLKQQLTKTTNQIAFLEQEIKKEAIELIQFIDQDGNDIIIFREGIKKLMSTLNCRYKLIEARNSPSDDVKKLLEDGVISKKSLDTEIYEKIKNELSELLEDSADVSEEGSTKILTLNRVDHRKLSSGTQICLYYYSLIYDTPPNAIILWDEPENGLHATRRFKLLNYFLKDQHQFILGTHATEFTPVMNPLCKVYQKFSSFDRIKKQLVLSINPASHRKDAFEIAERLGIYPATTLFTANVVIWVEGPTELKFWQKCISQASKEYSLVEGFDYTFCLYGGSNISNCDINDDESLVPGFDLLSLCRYPIVLVDSDFKKAPDGATKDLLKKGAAKMLTEIDLLNKSRKESGLFEYTLGREIENYLPDNILQKTLSELGTYTNDELTQLKIENFKLDQYERYFESFEKFVINAGMCFPNKDGELKAKNYTKWGENQKLNLMKKALSYDDFSVENLKYDGYSQAKRITEWIHRRRVDPKYKLKL